MQGKSQACNKAAAFVRLFLGFVLEEASKSGIRIPTLLSAIPKYHLAVMV